jgi:hypothetical protein
MADANSAMLNAPVNANNPAKKYDRKIAGPTLGKAIPGKMKIPELIIAPVATAKTSINPKSFLSSIAPLFVFFACFKLCCFLPNSFHVIFHVIPANLLSGNPAVNALSKRFPIKTFGNDN